MSKTNSGWYKTHRPTTIDDYIFQNDFDKNRILKYIEDGDIPDLLFSGHRGTGKTTLALILKDALGVEDVDFHKFNASDDNSVNVIRDMIKGLVTTMSLGEFRLIFMDEADALTPQAQDALKSMMEDENRNARFIFTCNKPHKLTPELRSRCTEYTFGTLSEENVLKAAIRILRAENVNIKESLMQLRDHLSITYPDLRKFITNLEKHYIDGKITPPNNASDGNELFPDFLACIEEGEWNVARELIYGDLLVDDIGNLYRFLDSNILTLSKFNEDNVRSAKAIFTLAHYASLHETVALPELNLTACIIKLCEL